MGEKLQGRPGGAVSLAVGMAYIFSAIPLMKNLMAYWYHFAIMFEAVFILTAVDTGTRVGRYMLQEMLGKVWPKFAEKRWMPGIILTSLLFTGAWGYLVYTGDIATIWPLFGMGNQLLATCAPHRRHHHADPPGQGPLCLDHRGAGLFMARVTFWAGYLNIVHNYLPTGHYLLAVLAITVMVLMAIVFVLAVRRWIKLLRIPTRIPDAWGEPVLEVVPE